MRRHPLERSRTGPGSGTQGPVLLCFSIIYIYIYIYIYIVYKYIVFEYILMHITLKVQLYMYVQASLGALRSIAVLEGHSRACQAVAFSPDGATLATGSAVGTVKLWDVASRRCVATLEGHDGAVSSISFSCDGGTLASYRYLRPGPDIRFYEK